MFPSIFNDFRWFNRKADPAHYPIFQKEVDELLANSAIEVSTGDVGFHSSIFVVPKHTGGLQLILNLKQYNCFVQMPTFRMTTIRQVQQLFQHGDYDFPIDLKDAYLHFQYCHYFYGFFGITDLISVRYCLLGW